MNKFLLLNAVLLPLLISSCNNDDKKDDAPAEEIIEEMANDDDMEDFPSDQSGSHFNRVSSFFVCEQIDVNCNDDSETSAEIVAASTDGMTLIYTDSPMDQIGFVDIADAHNPQSKGVLSMNGEPTSVAVLNDYALVAVNTSVDYINVSGVLNVVDIQSQQIVHSIDLTGQPDSIGVSKDGQYALVAIENERDEDLGDGEPGQLPAGKLVVIDLVGEPTSWTASDILLTGMDMLYPTDPEPEYVDINSKNQAVVTLQENNHIVIVDLETKTIIDDFSAGFVDLTQIDLTDEKPHNIYQTQSLMNIPREPDGVTWADDTHFITADEGDLNGGSRGFTIFNITGEVVWGSGNQLEHLTASLGHYPDKRSDSKGNEPENADVGVFGSTLYSFINSERSSLTFVYDLSDMSAPNYKQVLPAAVAPEGVLAIPQRDLLIVASEADNRGDKLRSALNIYSYSVKEAAYPNIHSEVTAGKAPITWAALSALTHDTQNEKTLYSVNDSFFASNKIFTIDISVKPALITNELIIKDSNNILANIAVEADDMADIDNVFTAEDLSALINDDKSINIDPEGLVQSTDGGFWIASEGNGTINDASRPIKSLNMLIKTDSLGVITQVVLLPKAVNDKQIRFGFEGVAEFDGKLIVTFQRAWADETHARIGIYDLNTTQWKFVMYPLDVAQSQAGGWVGLSDIAALGENKYLILERDNQSGFDAAIKRIYEIDLNNIIEGEVITKTLYKDLTLELAKNNGLIVEKIEGIAVDKAGNIWINNDNDGVDDNSGENLLINLGQY